MCSFLSGSALDTIEEKRNVANRNAHNFLIISYLRMENYKMSNKIINILLIACMLLGATIVGTLVYKEYGSKSAEEHKWDNWQKPIDPKTIVKPIAPDIKPEPEVKPITSEIMKYGDALKLAQATDRKIFVLFTADWCHWCTKLKNETLADPRVKDALKNHIICYVNTDQEREIARRFAVAGLPSYFVIDKKETVEKRGSGMKTSDEFIRWLIGSKPPLLRPRL